MAASGCCGCGGLELGAARGEEEHDTEPEEDEDEEGAAAVTAAPEEDDNDDDEDGPPLIELLPEIRRTATLAFHKEPAETVAAHARRSSPC